MQAEEILKFVGKSVSDDSLKQWLLSSGNGELKLEEGDYRAYIERPEHGYCLIFTDEAVFLGVDEQAIGVGSLYLSGVFFYSEGKDGYKQFECELPQKVEFDDNAEDLRNKLGMAEWVRHDEDGSLISERWDYKQFKFHVTYGGKGTVDVISISQPDKT